MVGLEIAKPVLTFDMLQVGIKNTAMGVRVIKDFFGPCNYEDFREANRDGVDIPEVTRQRVDRLVYQQVGEMFGVKGGKKKFWEDSMKLSNSTVNYARRILFPDQDRKATLTVDIDWEDLRPSSALDNLTQSTSLIGQQCRYEQGRQLALGLLCAEVISSDENGTSRRMLKAINKFLTKNLFQGKKGDPTMYPFFSYHEPQTNKLVALSSSGIDSPRPGLWVKFLEFPVRMARIVDPLTGEAQVVPVLYDQREKETESAVIKALRKSLQTANLSNGIDPFSGLIDRLGFRLVLMTGDRLLRDKLNIQLSELFTQFKGIEELVPIDEVDSQNGHSNRVEFRRWHIYTARLKRPVESIVQSLAHYIPYMYEVGQFDPQKGMHDGVAHDLYKLQVVSEVAEYLWPKQIFGFDVADAIKPTSYEYATRLGRKERVSPSPYEGES